MFKKMCLIVLLVALISIFGAGTFKTANAQVCTGHDFIINLTGVERDNGDVFIYKYTVSTCDLDINKMSILNFAIDANLHVIETENVKVRPAGYGSLADGWLQGVPQLQVLTITAQSYTVSDPLVIKISGTNGSVGDIAAHTKAGNKIET